jgi:hypothetical protein
MIRQKQEFAIYKNDDFICIGTAKECAEMLNVKVDTIYFYATPTHLMRSGIDVKKFSNLVFKKK